MKCTLCCLFDMEHNSLTSIACARPIIYAEGLFASCYLDEGEFVPKEGISQTDLWSILSGEILKTGSDLVEDYSLKSKLNRLTSVSTDTFELDQFPKDNFYSSCNLEEENIDINKKNDIGRQLIDNESIPMFQIRKISGEDQNNCLTNDTSISEQMKLRKLYEQQVSFIMGEDGEEFVFMETFSQFTDALILLDVLKQFNVPSVVSFLAQRDEPIAFTFSKTKIGLDCLIFCLFQA